MIDVYLRPGDLVVSTKKIFLLTRQTPSYWYYYVEGRDCRGGLPGRVFKNKLWKLLDTSRGKITVKFGSSLSRRKKKRKNRILDLHSTKHKEADEKIRNYLNFVELPTEIITGDSEKMRQILIKIVEEYGWTANPSAGNPGRVQICSE